MRSIESAGNHPKLGVGQLYPSFTLAETCFDYA
jgi:hypothetical protein